MNAQQLKDNLEQFSGTDGWHKFNCLYRKVLATEGAMYLAKEAGAYWLLEMIASHRRKLINHQGTAKLVVTDSTAVFTLTDCEAGIVATQEIPYTDFPLPEIKLYISEQEDDYWSICLPSEN